MYIDYAIKQVITEIDNGFSFSPIIATAVFVIASCGIRKVIESGANGAVCRLVKRFDAEL